MSLLSVSKMFNRAHVSSPFRKVYCKDYVLLMSSFIARTQDYPNRVMSVVVPTSAWDMMYTVLRRNGMASGSERVFNIQYDSAKLD